METTFDKSISGKSDIVNSKPAQMKEKPEGKKITQGIATSKPDDMECEVGTE